MAKLVSAKKNYNLNTTKIFCNISRVLYGEYKLTTSRNIKLEEITNNDIKYVNNLIQPISSYSRYYNVKSSLYDLNAIHITSYQGLIYTSNRKSNDIFKNSINNTILLSQSNEVGVLLNSHGIILSNLTLQLIQTVSDTCIRYTTIYTLNIDNNEFNKSSNPTWSSSINYTYITTIGLYDLNNNLLAVGRLSRPVKILKNLQFILKVAVLV